MAARRHVRLHIILVHVHMYVYTLYYAVLFPTLLEGEFRLKCVGLKYSVQLYNRLCDLEKEIKRILGEATYIRNMIGIGCIHVVLRSTIHRSTLSYNTPYIGRCLMSQPSFCILCDTLYPTIRPYIRLYCTRVHMYLYHRRRSEVTQDNNLSYI